MPAESGPPCAHLPSNEGPRRKRINGIAGSRYQRDVYRVQVGVCSQTREMVIRVGFDWRSAVPLMNRTLHCYFWRSGGPEPRRQFNAMERNVMGSSAKVSIGDTARGIPRGRGVSIGVVPRPPLRARRAIGLSAVIGDSRCGSMASRGMQIRRSSRWSKESKCGHSPYS